ncbi:MAG: ATP-binding protein [Pseudohongiellaceae bacterium]
MSQQPRHSKADLLLQFQFQAQASELCKVRQKLRETLEKCCASESLMNCIILAVGEACMNIIQHAYGTEDRGDIILEVHSQGDSLTFRLTDFAQRKTCQADMRSRPLDEVRPGGLGCHLINEIMDEVSLLECSADCGNVLQMKKCLQEE